MIDIPLGKALVPVEVLSPYCNDCYFINDHYKCLVDKNLTCGCLSRKDGKNVIFKLVDYPAKEKL